MIKIKTYIRRTLLLISLVITLLFNTICVQAVATSFSDVPKGYWAYNQIMDIASRGLIVGTTPLQNGVGTFNPNGQMRKCELITIISRLLYSNEMSKYAGATKWYDSAYYTCINNRLFTQDEIPYSTLNNQMTREEMAMILAKTDRLLNGEHQITISSSSIPDYNSITQKYKDYVLYSYSRGIFCGVDSKGTFLPKSILTRAQSAVVIYRLLNTQILSNQQPVQTPSSNVNNNNDNSKPDDSKPANTNSLDIDTSTSNDGYIRVCVASTKKIKVRITTNGKEYTYTIPNDGSYCKLPLSEGNRTYKIEVFENIQGIKYKTLKTKNITASISNPYSPFLTSNLYINYSNKTSSVIKANELTQGCKTQIEKINNIYNYIVNNFKYDTKKATTVEPGYIPDINNIMNIKKGICYDYAVVMASMLRSQNIPCKVVFGDAQNAYHAWVEVYTTESGWMNNYTYFDGQSWKLLDPTFVSSGKGSQKSINFVSNRNNYTPKYYY